MFLNQADVICVWATNLYLRNKLSKNNHPTFLTPQLILLSTIIKGRL